LSSRKVELSIDKFIIIQLTGSNYPERPSEEEINLVGIEIHASILLSGFTLFFKKAVNLPPRSKGS